MKKSKTLHALPKQSLLAHCEARDLDFEDNSGLRSVTPCHTCWDNSIRFHRTSPSLTRAMYLFQTWFDFRSAWDADRKCYESAWNGKLTGTDAICRRDKAQNGVWTSPPVVVNLASISGRADETGKKRTVMRLPLKFQFSTSEEARSAWKRMKMHFLQVEAKHLAGFK